MNHFGQLVVMTLTEKSEEEIVNGKHLASPQKKNSRKYSEFIFKIVYFALIFVSLKHTQGCVSES